MPTAGEYKERYAKAKALFDERCRTAGEKIYRTVEDVDGVLLLKVRQYDVAQSDPLMMGAAAAHESYGDFYIRSFLLYEREPTSTEVRSLVEDTTVTSRRGYRFVEVVDSSDHQRYRYTLGTDMRVKREKAHGASPRYGVTFEDVVDPEDRRYWVAGSTVKVLDLKTKETMGEFVRYVIEPGQGSRAGQRTPWLFSQGCGMKTSYGRSSSRLFVDQVLKPSKGE